MGERLRWPELEGVVLPIQGREDGTGGKRGIDGDRRAGSHSVECWRPGKDVDGAVRHARDGGERYDALTTVQGISDFSGFVAWRRLVLLPPIQRRLSQEPAKAEGAEVLGTHHRDVGASAERFGKGP